MSWTQPNSSLNRELTDFYESCIAVYTSDRNRVAEDVGKERGIAEGGYGRKQIQELVQNAADALLGSGGRVEVVLTDSTLYVANEGTPFTSSGLRALLYTHLSDKTGNEIGRFGLGFKAISGISDNPQVYSRSVSFEFSRERSATALSSLYSTPLAQSDAPTLRLAWPVVAQDRMNDDPILQELSWASTIVKAPLHPGAASELSQEVASFDESFSIFAPHVRTLVLEDRTSGTLREFRTTSRGKRVTLTTEDTSSEWIVFSREHRPSRAALDSAGYSASRESVKVSWAVPTTGRALGRLSAFFPVKSDISLKGRINAPWKLSDDRINVIECLFNKELLTEVLPHIVVDAREELIANGQYARYIDVIPAREKEAKTRSWADATMNEPIYEALRNSRCLPDLDGKLHSPTQLKSVPAGLDEWNDQWLELTSDRARWVHPDCTSTTERRSKVDRLMIRSVGGSVGRVKHWIEGIVSDSSLSGATAASRSSAAITLADAIMTRWPSGAAASKLPPAREDIRDSRIVLLSTGQFQTPVPGRCFIASSTATTGGSLIDLRVSADDRARHALERFGITEFDDDGSNLLELLQGLRNARVPDWDALWSALRSTDIDTVRSAFSSVLSDKAPQAVRVKGAEGAWVEARGRYLPGRMRPQAADLRFFVDGNYHRSDNELLELLGVSDRPRPHTKHRPESWIDRFRSWIVEKAGDQWELGPQKRQEITIDGLDRALGPLEFLGELTVHNRVALTELTLAAMTDSRVKATNPQTRSSISTAAAEIWHIRRVGMLSTSLGPMPVKEVFVPDVHELVDIPDGVLPRATNLEASTSVIEALRLKSGVDDVTVKTMTAAQDAHFERNDGAMLGVVYGWWCHLFVDSCPERVAAYVGETLEYCTVDDVALVVSESEEHELREFRIPFLRVPGEDLENMIVSWGFNRASSLPIGYEFDTSAEPSTFGDLFPGVEVDEDPDLIDRQVQPCSTIRKVAQIPDRPSISVDARHGQHGDVLLVTGATDTERLANILDAIGADNSPEQLDVYTTQMRERRIKLKKFGLQQFDSDAERLLDLVGERRLITLVHDGARPHLEPSDLTGIKLAELCVTLYGASVLERACSIDSQSMEIPPPDRWNGARKTREWVTALRFPESWAGKRTQTSAKPAEYVDGPADLERLHDYQREVAEQVREVLIGGGPNRGIVMLPTGAGKTRVAVQTIIEAITSGALDKRDDEFRGPVLWLADTEELCEQAVSTWAHIWRGCGRANTRLIVSRFWGAHDLTEESTTGAVQVVVASWQKLRKAITGTDITWLSEAPIVVIDEAHGAIHASYTKILSWLHRDQYSRDRTLIGLTATPFRGSGEDSKESARLRRRFDDNIISFKTDGGVGQLKHLQTMNVLSRVTTEELTGVDITLTSGDTRMFKETRTLPKRNETTLGENEVRTARIVDSIMSKPDDWSILVFATSVDNARVLATVLTAHGRPAASIDQETSANERRDIIKRFNEGTLKVVTNYGVLSQGFDAPHTRAVYVTRPTSSAVLYRQMVGRGMRGPANGGTPEVLIVNVLDNIIRHEDALEAMDDRNVPGLPLEAIAEDFGDASEFDAAR